MLPLLLTLSLAVQDSGAFVVRIGTDTLSMEQFKRTATQLHGEYVIRSPRSLHRIYTADLNPDGSIRRLEIITHNIGNAPGPAETKMSMTFSGDSAVMVYPRGDSTATARLAVPRGTIPFQLYVFGLVEQIGRMARAGGKDSTLQVEVTRLASVPLAQVTQSFANRPLGQLSVRDTARASIGSAAVWVDYGRPQKRGREIFGNVVPWNSVWRTGANAATQFNTTADLVIGGATVPAGKYTLWTLPTPTGWKLIINKQTGQWGTEYHAEQDLVRVDTKVETLPAPVEQLVIAFEPGLLTFTWDKTRVSVPVATK